MEFKYQRGLSGKLQLLQGELFVRKSSSGKSVFVALHRDWLWDTGRVLVTKIRNWWRLSLPCVAPITAFCLFVGNCQSETAVHRTAFWHWVCEGGIKSQGHWEEVVPRRWWRVGCHRRRGNSQHFSAPKRYCSFSFDLGARWALDWWASCHSLAL